MKSLQLGVIGLGTMGANLARNAARNGAKVAVYNRTKDKTDALINQYGSEGKFVACSEIKDFKKELSTPRAILLMVKAGKAVDEVILELISHLDKGDIIIDGGNSHFTDTERRFEDLAKHQIRFLGMGVSGGEDGALNGPSMMPGGDSAAYEHLKPLLLKMVAQVEGWNASSELSTGVGRLESVKQDDDSARCVSYMGTGGAGHFVKMVHNGIEYGIMQLIAESYDLLKHEGGKSNAELVDIFNTWNDGDDLNSYLMEITAKIFVKKNDASLGSARDDIYIIDLIKDVAGQKGTGKWTTEAAMTYGVAIPTINAAVDARILSGDVCLRKSLLSSPETLVEHSMKADDLVSSVRSALELSILCAYLQGLELIRKVSEEKNWNVNMQEVCRIWRGGCIIRSSRLEPLQRLFAGDKKAHNELNDRFAGERQMHWRSVIALGASRGIPLPAMSASLAYYDAYRRERLPQNLIQAQRDFFGAHTYERIDIKGVFHTDWISAMS